MHNDKALYPLSESQKSIWYLEKAYPGTSLNIIAGNLRIKGEIDYPALGKALNLFVKKNDAMRLQIYEEDGVAAQAVVPYEESEVEHFDFSKSGGLKELFSWDEGKTRTPFDIINSRLYYCATYKVSDEEGGFYVKMHHLISDAWTMGLATRQVIDLYSKIRNNEAIDESPGPSFIEHLASEAEYEKSPRFEKDKAYWSRKFETLPEMTVLKPLKAGVNSIAAKRKTLITPLKLSNKIREFCAVNNVTVFTLFMSALSIYINRVTGIDDIVLGTTILNRINYREKETAGMFVSVAAPVRISIDDSMDFKTFARAMLKENTDVLRHQKYPYNYLIRDLKKKHKFPNRLFDIVLNYQNTKFQKKKTEMEYTAKWIFSGSQVESLIISVNDREDSGNLIIDYDFLTDVFNIKEIEFIHQHISSLLWHALDNPLKKISKLEMISEKEKHIILHVFNNTYADYPRDKTIHQMFEEQAEKTPDNTALIFNDKTMTYTELNEKSNRLAHTLREKGVGPDRIVAIIAYRSFEMIIGIIGILKAGGAYMPIDPDYPEERKNFMLKSSCTCILLAQRGLLDSVEFGGLKIDLDDTASYSSETINLPSNITPRNLAYVIYTSGSTGSPKGVMVEHSGVINRINWMLNKLPFSKNSVIMQKTTYAFDVSVWELFSWAFIGASLCLIYSGDEKEPEAIISAVEKNKVTDIHFVPSMLSVFLDYVDSRGCSGRLKSLVNVFASGEALTVHQVQRFNRIMFETYGSKLYNLYGPTEATVEASYFECSPMPAALNSVPIGRPIDNVNLYIFDKNQNILPVGIPGELFIGGAGVARGYLHNPELTAEKFVINPYKRNEILYKTGDRVRWYPKGDIEFLGRLDNQVKVRGFRIELGEIENRLMMHPDVKAAVVVAFSDDDNLSWLAAFVVAEKPLSAGALGGYLAETLPSYMVPSSFSFLDKMPQTASGKIDRKALPKPEYIGSTDTAYAPPDGEIENVLADIWQKVLGVSQIGVFDEYTAVGGDSLKAIMITTDINRKWDIEVSPREIFQAVNIRELAKLVKKAASAHYTPIPKVEKSAWYPVSAAQKRIYAESQINEGTVFNMPNCHIINGVLEHGRLRDALQKIVQRHESLRTSIEMHKGLPVQIIHEDIDVDILQIVTDETDIDKLMSDFTRPFDLTEAPLLRIGIARLSEKKHLLMMNVHHIISDGASLNIIIREMTELLSGKTPAELNIQYKDYSAWHNEFLRSEKAQKQKAFWLSRLSGEIPVLNMPLDFVRPQQKSMEGSTLYSTIDMELLGELKKLMVLTETTLYMLLLSAYGVLLFTYTGQEDIVIGIPVEGRNHPDLHDIVGSFVNNVVLRSHPSGEKTFKSYLNEVKEELINVFDNQDYPVDELLAELRHSSDIGPFFSTLFMMQNIGSTELNIDTFKLERYNYNIKRSIVDLGVGAYYYDETITLRLEYCTKLFKADSMERFMRNYEIILREIVGNPLKKLGDIRCEAGLD